MAKRRTEQPGSLNVPWITKDGHIHLGALPIEPIMKQALNKDEDLFRGAVQVLASMCSARRREAEIFLYGLMHVHRDDLVRKEVIVEVLARLNNKSAADVLFAELDSITSSNTTRVYIKAVLRALTQLPPKLTEEGFRRLLGQDKWSYKMKHKFQAILDGKDWRYL